MEGIENLTVCILLKTQIYKSIIGLIFEALFSKKVKKTLLIYNE